MLEPAPGLPTGTIATLAASTRLGFSVPSMKPVRSRSWWYGHPTISCTSVAHGASASRTARVTSNTASYSPPAIQMTASCWVACIVTPVGPETADRKLVTPAGASPGATLAHSSGRKPTTRLTPPIVVRGSRNPATAPTSTAGAAPGARSSSRYTWDMVPSAKMPVWGVGMMDIIAQSRTRRRPAWHT